MRTWFFLVVMAFLGLSVTGCGDNPYKADIEELDSIKIEVIAANKVFKTIDSTSLRRIGHAVFEDLRKVQRTYKPDTIDMSTSMLINNYKDLRKRCAKYTMIQARMRKNFPYTIKQLEDIIHDLNEQALSKDEAEKYIEVEKRATMSLLDAFRMYQQGVPDVIKKYDSLQPKIAELLQIASDSLQ